MNFAEIDHQKHPADQGLGELSYTSVSADPSGLVNLSKIYPRTHRTGDAVFAKTLLHSDEAEIREITFGYSDVISVFLNGQSYFTGVSTYRSRDHSFLGIIGMNDQVYLPLEKGDNEIMLMMAEGYGGWGFMMQTNDTYIDDRMAKKWETDDVFKVPESVVYDATKEVLYITNFDQFARNNTGREQFISKLSLKGEIIDLHFIDSLDNPLGMKLAGGKLYIAEKGGIAIADISAQKVIDRITIKDCEFPNDIEVDANGSIYVSDSRKNVVWRVTEGQIEIWLTEGQVMDPNTLRIIDGRLYVGNSGFQQLNAYDLADKSMELITDFEPGFIDGIRIIPGNGLLVSLWGGKLFHISGSGETTKLLDLKNQGIYIADFEYVHENNMVYIPGFFTNTVMAYELKW